MLEIGVPKIDVIVLHLGCSFFFFTGPFRGKSSNAGRLLFCCLVGPEKNMLRGPEKNMLRVSYTD
jgi:hypothetical protein